MLFITSQILIETRAVARPPKQIVKQEPLAQQLPADHFGVQLMRTAARIKARVQAGRAREAMMIGSIDPPWLVPEQSLSEIGRECTFRLLVASAACLAVASAHARRFDLASCFARASVEVLGLGVGRSQVCEGGANIATEEAGLAAARICLAWVRLHGGGLQFAVLWMLTQGLVCLATRQEPPAGVLDRLVCTVACTPDPPQLSAAGAHNFTLALLGCGGSIVHRH